MEAEIKAGPLAGDIQEAARLLSISTGTLKNLISSGDLKSIKIMRRRLIPVDELKSLLKTGQ
jgi:excisionase family DNA binding protein